MLSTLARVNNLDSGAPKLRTASGFIRGEEPWTGGPVSEHVLGIHPDNPCPMTFTGTNTWIVTARKAGVCAVVDPAPDGAHVARILRACERAEVVPVAILVTHHHPDHIEGIPELLRRTGAHVYARDVACIERLAESCGVRAEVRGLPDGELEVLGDEVPIDVVSLPGHSPDSVGFVLPRERLMISGDVVFAQGPTVLPYPEGSLANYFASLAKIEAMVARGELRCLLTGHGRPVCEIARVVDATRAHRRRRLKQIEEHLASGVVPTPEALFDAIYVGVDESLRQVALEGIQTQLDYLFC